MTNEPLEKTAFRGMVYLTLKLPVYFKSKESQSGSKTSMMYLKAILEELFENAQISGESSDKIQTFIESVRQEFEKGGYLDEGSYLKELKSILLEFSGGKFFYENVILPSLTDEELDKIEDASEFFSEVSRRSSKKRTPVAEDCNSDFKEMVRRANKEYDEQCNLNGDV